MDPQAPGLLDQAVWIGLPWPTSGRPAPQFSTTMTAARAGNVWLDVTALGIVRGWLEGDELPLGRLAPGWSDYRDHVRVIRRRMPVDAGTHELTFELGEGWWSGHVGYHRVHRRYGDRLWLRAQVTDEAGDVLAATGPDWVGRFGPVTSNDLHDGQSTDLTKVEEPWEPVEVGEPEHGRLVLDTGPAIEVVEDVPAISVEAVLPGVQVVDVGRNLAGHVRLVVDVDRETELALRHAEWLEEDGTLYRANLREARQTDRWRLPPGRHVLEPAFTTHGFRYVEVTGAPPLTPADVTARVVRSDLERVGWFTCSDERVNRLHQLAVWSIESNSIGLPTDCPQRDERLGWLEDVTALVPTRAFLFDHRDFLSRWLEDVRSAQADDGWLPDVAPLAGSERNPLDQGAPGWADAGVQVPWLQHQWYGDVGVVRDNLDMGGRFVAAVEASNADGRWTHRRGADYGDWLGFLPASKDLVAQAHAARSARCLAEMAALVGDRDLEARARAWDERVRAAFVRDFVDDGHVGDRSASASTFALAYDLLPEGWMRRVAAEDLVAHVRAHENAVTVGYLALPHLLHVLTERGRPDVAYDLLFGEQMPGWMHLVDNGATSLWERWDGWDHDTGLHQAWLNSLNHASLGVVADWLHATVGGIAPAAPGWSTVRVAPVPGGRVTGASARHRSPRGEVAIEWAGTVEQGEARATVPPDTAVVVPAPNAHPTDRVPRHAGSPDGLEVRVTWSGNQRGVQIKAR